MVVRQTIKLSRLAAGDQSVNYINEYRDPTSSFVKENSIRFFEDYKNLEK